MANLNRGLIAQYVVDVAGEAVDDSSMDAALYLHADLDPLLFDAKY